MFIYISVFVGILLVVVIGGYYFLPNSQFSLSFSKKNFVLIVVVLAAIFLYLLGFGIYNQVHPHESIRIVHIDNKAYLVDGIKGKVMFLQNTKIHAGKPYKTVLFTWAPVNEGMSYSYNFDGTKTSSPLKITETNDPLYNQLRLSVGAKYMYDITLTYPAPGKFETTFGEKQHTMGTIMIDVYK